MAVDPQMMQQMMGQIGGGEPPMDPSQAGPPQGGPPVDPAMMEQLLASLGGGQPQAQTAPPPAEDWLATAINSVHQGMVAEKDPNQVSLLGAILNQLTTFQAKDMSKGGSPQGG